MKTAKMKSCDLSDHCFLTKLFPLAEMSVVNKKWTCPTSGSYTILDASKFVENFKVKEITYIGMQLIDIWLQFYLHNIFAIRSQKQEN